MSTSARSVSEGRGGLWAFYHRLPTLLLLLFLAGYVRPSYLDVLDFASELLADPARAAQISVANRLPRTEVAAPTSLDETTEGAGAAAAVAHNALALRVIRAAYRRSNPGADFGAATPAPSSSSGSSGASLPEIKGAVPWLLSVEELCAHWRASPSYASLISTTGVPAPAAAVAGTLDVNAGRFGRSLFGGVSLPTAGAQSAYGRSVPVSFGRQVALVAGRQGRLLLRNRALLVARMMNSLIMAAVLATLFTNLALSNFPAKIGLALLSAMYV
jgi:hypothetical protein